MQFYLRFVVASLVSWFVSYSLSFEVGQIVRFVLLGLGLSERGLKRLCGVLIEPLFTAGAVTVFVVTYLKVQSPLVESTGVLISLAVSFLVPSFVIAVYMKIRTVQRSAEGLKWWSPFRISATTICHLALTIHLWVIVLIIRVIFTLIMAVLSIAKLEKYEQITQEAVKPVLEILERAEPNKSFFIITANINGILILITLTAAYWTIGIADLIQFIQFSLYLFAALFLIELVLLAWMQKPEAAQLRWVNPFALAGSFVILFTFHVTIYQEQSAQQAVPYIAFLMFLWYVCYLSRREVTIEEGRQATLSEDRDFQIDTARYAIAWFHLLLVRLQPLFLMIALSNAAPEGVADLGGVMVYSWIRALLVTVMVMLVVGLTSLVICARNIRKPELIYTENGKTKKLAGTEGRDKYPVYRDQLAASALPYCIFVPAMVFTILSLLGKSPLRFAGMGVWLDALFYFLLALFLFGVFVQVPYRNGKLERLEREFKALPRLSRKIEKNIAKSYRSKSYDVRTQLQIIAGEMTLHRLRNARHEQRGELIYRFNLFGENISGTDALNFIRGIIVTAFAAGLAFLVKLLFELPAD